MLIYMLIVLKSGECYNIFSIVYMTEITCSYIYMSIIMITSMYERTIKYGTSYYIQ